jgi:hypothetical protein
MTNLLTELEVKEISIVPWGANNKKFLCIKDKDGKVLTNSDWFISKQMESVDMAIDQVERDKIVKEATEKAAKDAAELLKKEADEKLRLEKELKDATDAKAKLEKEQKEAMEKAVSEKAALAKELLDMKKEVQDAKEATKIEKDARLLSIHKEFAKENLPLLGDHTELGVFLKESKEVLTEKSYTFLETMLKSANEKIAKGGLFIELGKDNNQSANGNILDKINKMASDIMIADKVGYEQAISKVFEKDAKLYEEYEKANK